MPEKTPDRRSTVIARRTIPYYRNPISGFLGAFRKDGPGA
jgi:hypothetical protein